MFSFKLSLPLLDFYTFSFVPCFKAIVDLFFSFECAYSVQNWIAVCFLSVKSSYSHQKELYGGNSISFPETKWNLKEEKGRRHCYC